MAQNSSLNELKRRFVRNSNKNDFKYEKLNEINDKTNAEYWSHRNRIPWRAICLALFLLVVGLALLVLSLLISMGLIETMQTTEQLLVLLFLGFLMFIPGFYHMRIAVFAYYRYEGFTFDSIPDFD